MHSSARQSADLDSTLSWRLQVCDAEFKPDLTDKICQLVQRFAPEKRWHIDSLLQVTAAPPVDLSKTFNAACL